MHYLAAFSPEDGGYVVTFPDLPGCVTEGDDFNTAFANALEALGAYVEDLDAAGEPRPRPTDALGVIPPEARGVFVPVLVDRGRPRRVNVTFDPGLLEAIDDAARRRSMTRAAFLASAARRELTAG